MLPRLTLLLMILLAFSEPALADEPNQVGLVIQFDEERVETLCLAFDGDEIRGDRLLAHSSLDVIVDASSSMGVTVCQIEGQGCAYPAEHCFCECMGIGGSGCAYWNYFYRDPGAEDWTYSALGAVLRQAKPGSVEAWVWGDGHISPADTLTFEAICGLPTASAALAAQSPESPTPVTAIATVGAPNPTPTRPPATPSAVPPSPTTPAPESGADANLDLSRYWPFGLMVLGLLTIGAIVWLRRTRPGNRM
ncbi:MAG: hypothetical protein PVH17_01400 [Anaerolineae bacterium]|jgi:hypothetical protein